MTFSNDQIEAIRQGVPIRVVLPEIGEECVVLRATAYEGMAQAASEPDARQAYAAIDEAWKQDWDAPGMEDYDHYEEHRT